MTRWRKSHAPIPEFERGACIISAPAETGAAMGLNIQIDETLTYQIADARTGSANLLAALCRHHDFNMRIPKDWVPPVKPEKQLLPPAKPVWFSVTDNYPKIREIQWAVADYYRIDATDLLSQRRTAKIVRPRQVAYYLCKKLTIKSLPEIGRRFGRDHTSVLHGVRLIAINRTVDKQLDQDIRNIAEMFGGLHENAA